MNTNIPPHYPRMLGELESDKWYTKKDLVENINIAKGQQ